MISVLPSGPTPPTAGFGATPTSGQAPLLVNFSDTSTGTPTSWAWSFGDGATSTLQNPQHSYALAGNYTVSLTATNAGGNDTLIEPNLITVSDLPTGQGFVLSKNADFSTDDRNFARADTLHMLVFSDLLNITNIKKAQWVIDDPNGRDEKGNLVDNGDGTFTASLPLANLPSNATQWSWSAFVEDGSGQSFEPAASLTVLP
jgi:PKD repeat protein